MTRDRRPPSPTAAYCLEPPNLIRWRGELVVSPRVYHLLARVLAVPAHVRAIDFDTFKRDVLRNELAPDDRVRRRVSELSLACSAVGFPWSFSTKLGYVVIDRGG